MAPRWFAFLLAAMAPAIASGQHVDLYPYNDQGKIGVAEYNYDQGAVIERRAFSGRFNSFYSVNNPGFSTEAASAPLPGSASLDWDFVPMTEGAYTSTLLYWDGVGETPDFSPTPTDEYALFLFGKSGPVAADGGDQLVVGNSLGITGPSGGMHEHNYFFLDDNGDGTNNTLPVAGYYLIALQLRMAGLETSDPFFLLWGTPDSDALLQAQVAIPWVEANADGLLAGGLPGDFNGDGAVDAADYTVWRDDGGATYTAADYTTWAGNYGAHAGGAGTAAVPEPAAIAILAIATGCLFLRR